jgi:aspartyl-tRNA(Asn)/glutamyl-tRNA(Gln) amidotransferase subunit C
MISKEDLEKISKLSCLDLVDQDQKAVLDSLSNLLKYFKQLEGLDTTGVEPLYQLKEQIDMRLDEPQSLLSSDEFLKNTISSIDDYIQIPQVVTHEDR